MAARRTLLWRWGGAVSRGAGGYHAVVGVWKVPHHSHLYLLGQELTIATNGVLGEAETKEERECLCACLFDLFAVLLEHEHRRNVDIGPGRGIHIRYTHNSSLHVV